MMYKTKSLAIRIIITGSLVALVFGLTGCQSISPDKAECREYKNYVPQEEGCIGPVRIRAREGAMEAEIPLLNF